MSPEFLEAFNLLMQFEVGPTATGLVNDPADHGGLTKYGISQKSYPDLNIAALSRYDAQAIFYRDFWQAYSLDSLCSKSKHLTFRIFIMGVLCGMTESIKLAQAAVNLLSDQAPVAVDGKLGPATFMALQNFRNPAALVAAHKILIGQHLIAIGQKRFLAGWLVRNNAV